MSPQRWSPGLARWQRLRAFAPPISRAAAGIPHQTNDARKKALETTRASGVADARGPEVHGLERALGLREGGGKRQRAWRRAEEEGGDRKRRRGARQVSRSRRRRKRRAHRKQLQSSVRASPLRSSNTRRQAGSAESAPGDLRRAFVPDDAPDSPLVSVHDELEASQPRRREPCPREPRRERAPARRPAGAREAAPVEPKLLERRRRAEEERGECGGGVGAAEGAVEEVDAGEGGAGGGDRGEEEGAPAGL